MAWKAAPRMRWSLLGLLSLCLAGAPVAAAKATAGEPTMLGGVSVMAVDRSSNSGQVWLHFRNDTRAATPLAISLGDFTSRATGRVLNTQATFFKGAETAGAPFLEHRLNPGDRLSVRIQVSNLWEAGESTAPLSINGRTHLLRAIHYDVPFNVGIQVATPTEPRLSFERGRPGLLVLKNDDPMSYGVDWRLFIPNEGAVLSGTILLPPKSTVPVPVTPPEAWFSGWFGAFFKDKQGSGLLTLQYAPKAETDAPGLPVRTVPVELGLAYWSDTTQAIVGGLIVFLALLLGGVCSLFLSLWIPNKLLQVDLARRLDELAGKTRDISAKVDSNLRVAVRVERLRLRETLASLWMVSADVPEALRGFEKRIETLGRRIDLATRISRATGKLEGLRSDTAQAPATLLGEVANSLTGAAELLRKGDPPEEEFQQAQAKIRSAEGRLENLAQEDPEFARTLASRVQDLRKEYDPKTGPTGTRAKCQELRPKLAEAFKIIEDTTYEDESNILPSKYHWIDMSIEKLYVLRHFVVRFEEAAPDPERHRRIATCERDLLGYLKRQDWVALNLARQLRREIDEDVFGQRIEAELKQKRIGLEKEPLTAYPNEQVRLTARFHQPALNTSAALNEFDCVWQFPDPVGQEVGWEINHYFRNPEEAKFTVRFKKSNGEPVSEDGAGAPIVVAGSVPLQEKRRDQFGDRSKLEAGRFLVALGVALVGLIAGAREQLLKLDVLPGLIAVFLVGFGADAIKNLITKRP